MYPFYKPALLTKTKTQVFHANRENEYVLDSSLTALLLEEESSLEPGLAVMVQHEQRIVGLISERTERGPQQWYAVQILVLGHAELRRRGRRGGRRRCTTASAHGHPAAQPPSAGLAG